MDIPRPKVAKESTWSKNVEIQQRYTKRKMLPLRERAEQRRSSEREIISDSVPECVPDLSPNEKVSTEYTVLSIIDNRDTSRFYDNSLDN
jgi:hypothetical protein